MIDVMKPERISVRPISPPSQKQHDELVEKLELFQAGILDFVTIVVKSKDCPKSFTRGKDNVSKV